VGELGISASMKDSKAFLMHRIPFPATYLTTTNPVQILATTRFLSGFLSDALILEK
jgi:hypothetical protein